MTNAIVPEVLDDRLTQSLEDSPMTPAEQRKLVELETRIKTKLGNKMEADLAIGGALLQIQRERLYRGPEGGRRFDDYIKQESHRLTPDNQPIGVDSASYLRGFYYFREEVLSASGPGRGKTDLPLPTAAKQVRPLLFLLDHLRRDSGQINTANGSATYDDRRAAEAKAIEIWKAAVTEAKGKTPTFDQVNRARLADSAAAEQHRLRGRADTAPPQQTTASRPDPVATYQRANPEQFLEDVKDMANHSAREDGQPLPYPAAGAAGIPAWQLEQTENSALDAGEECKRISRAINDAHKAIGLLRGILYSQINTYGRDYLGFLRQVDAGVYSLHNIDEHVQQMGEDIAFITELLTADVGEGELAASTVTVDAFPTKA
jgi:hypothetical protein